MSRFSLDKKRMSAGEDRSGSIRRQPRVRMRWILSLGLLLTWNTLLASPRAARADTPPVISHIYLYDVYGTPIDVTMSYVDGHVTDPQGNTVYVTISYTKGHVYDVEDHLIGFITSHL